MDQAGHEGGELIILSLGPSELEGDALTFHIAQLAQGYGEQQKDRGEPDHRNLMLTSPVGIDEGENLADCLLEHISRQIADAPCLSHAPVEALDLI